MEKPLVNKKYILEKYPGKGGWTYAAIPEIFPDKNAHFGWVKVKGSIDDYKISNYRLMPMGNGKLFLPVKADIRKKTGKQAGDTVHIILYYDEGLLQIPEELLTCLKDEPAAFKQFFALKEGEQKLYVDWIYSAKKEITRIERIAISILKLLKKEPFRPDGE